MPKKLIIGNWKMNPQSLKEADILFKSIGAIALKAKNADIVMCPPFVYLSHLKELKLKKISLGGQDVFYESKGAFTGEVSPAMLSDAGASYVIVGHSERRMLGETDEIINKKLLAVLKVKLTPILCVGEEIREDDGSYLSVVKRQLSSCLAGIPKNKIKDIVIAYEPVWALSSTENRRDATPHDFEEMRIYIRKILTDMYSVAMASSVRILYGGSANKDNAESFLKAGASGLLSGKASLDPKNFGAIITIANNIT
ncbi:MAG: triose-phosphate isomerase [Patescibacteria group bacterium]